MPASGGGVVVANHFSAIDPPLVGIFSRRTIYFMAKVELLDVPVAGEVLRWLGTFGVKRGEGDRDAFAWPAGSCDTATSSGSSWRARGSSSAIQGPAHPGAAMVAIQEGVPVIPCGATRSSGRSRTGAAARPSGETRSISAAWRGTVAGTRRER